MVGGCVDKDTALVPGARLDADVLMDGAQIFKLAIADGDHCRRRK